MPPEVPLIDLAAQHARLRPALDALWSETLVDSGFIGGAAVEEFEAAFAKTMGHGHVVSCGNGTDAIELALDALDIGAGDEVIVPAMTWFSTGEAVTTRGARVVFADVDEVTNGLSVATVEPVLTPATRAVIVVHLYGCPANARGLAELCDRRGVALVEDCAQVHGGRAQGQPAGTWGRLATYSFFPSKNLGAFGDGGAVGTDDERLAERVRLLARHGQSARHRHELCGRNSRLDTLQARVLSAKLPHLREWVTERNALAEYYTQRLTDLPALRLPTHAPRGGDVHAFHLYVVRTGQRNALASALAEAGVQTAVHYPTPLHLQPAYASHVPAATAPVAEALGREVLSLPLYPGLTAPQQDAVTAAVRNFFHV